MGHFRRTAHRNVDVKTLFIVISRNFWNICFHFPFLSGKWFCIVFHFGTEKMIFQINYKGWRSGFGKALSNELIIYSFINHIINWFFNILITKWLITFLPVLYVSTGNFRWQLWDKSEKTLGPNNDYVLAERISVLWPAFCRFFCERKVLAELILLYGQYEKPSHFASYYHDMSSSI